MYSCDKLYEFSEMRQAGIAQSVVRRIGSAEVTGPIPVASFFIFVLRPGNESCFILLFPWSFFI